MTYDDWLEAPYQRACADEDDYRLWLEQHDLEDTEEAYLTYREVGWDECEPDDYPDEEPPPRWEP